MRVIITTAILTGLAVGAGCYADRIQDHLLNKATGGPAGPVEVPAPVPPEKQQVLDDFNDSNNQFEPSPDDPHKLVPVDPERRQAAEMSEIWGTVSQCAHGAAWIITMIGVVLLARKLRVKIWPPAEVVPQEFGSDPLPGPLEESGGTEGEEEAAQLAAALKGYLSTSEENEESAEESAERPSLLELLAAFKEKKAGG